MNVTVNRGAVSAGLLIALCSAAPASGQYEAEVGRWLMQDALDAPPEGGIVFTGSSSIRRWEYLQRDFADYNVIQRGLGGALFDDINARANDIVLSYNPRAVVVWAGTNDIASGSDGNEVYADYQQFVNTIHAAKADVEIFYLGIMPTPGRQGNRPQEDVANSQIASYAAGDARLHYVDLPAAFATLNPYGDPAFTGKFVDDIHLNKSGYNFWTDIIRPQVEAVVAPDKTYQPNANAMRRGESLLFDFGPLDSDDGEGTASPDVRGNYWNNWYDPTDGGRDILPGEHKGHLVETGGRDTGVALTLTAQFESNGKRNGGLATPSEALLGDLAVGTATVDYFFSTGDDQQGGGNDDDGGGFMLSGLDPTLEYEFAFFGSRNTTETRITEYKVLGDGEWVAQLQTSGDNIGADGTYDGNNDEIALVTGVRPDEFGQVFVDMTLIQGQFAYINAMQVTAVPEPASAAVVIGLGAGTLLRRRRR